MDKTILVNYIAHVLSEEVTLTAFEEVFDNTSLKEIKEFIELHQKLNSIATLDKCEKECQIEDAWSYYTRSLRRNGRRVVVRYPDHYSVAQINNDFEKAFTYLETMDANILESEIAEYEKARKSDEVILDLLGVKTDNDIAVETNNAIKVAKAKRRMQLVDIAATAVKEGVNVYAIVKFLNTMCGDDEEQAIFLNYYIYLQDITKHIIKAI